MPRKGGGGFHIYYIYNFFRILNLSYFPIFLCKPNTLTHPHSQITESHSFAHNLILSLTISLYRSLPLPCNPQGVVAVVAEILRRFNFL